LWDGIGAKFRVLEFYLFFAIFAFVYINVKVKVSSPRTDHEGPEVE